MPPSQVVAQGQSDHRAETSCRPRASKTARVTSSGSPIGASETSQAPTGGAGTLSRARLQVTLAAVPMRAFIPQAAATTFLTIRNLRGTADDLVAARSPIARQVVLTVRNGPAGPRTVVSDLAIPAHGSLTLGPFGDDVVLRDPAPFETSSSVPLTLTFRQGGTVTIDATVTAPGTP